MGWQAQKSYTEWLEDGDGKRKGIGPTPDTCGQLGHWQGSCSKRLLR
jgi:hypothetical protein